MRKRTRLGYWKIPKRGAVPSRDVLAELRFRKLDLQKFRRTKNGDM
jgi:hypothetical protein